MNLFVTEFNRTRANVLTGMIRSHKVIVPTSAPLPYPQEQLNPHFLRVLRSGTTGSEQVANAIALAEALEADETLRRQAEAQRIDVGDLRDMIADAREHLIEHSYGAEDDDV